MNGNVFDAHTFFDASTDGKVHDCQFPYRNPQVGADKPAGFKRFDPTTYGGYTAGENMVTVQSMEAAWTAGYRPYYPMEARKSSFFDKTLLKFDTTHNEPLGFGTSISVDIMFQY